MCDSVCLLYLLTYLLRRYKRGFVWWRPEGLAYEFTLAALGQRVASLGLLPAHGDG